ncbi:hypothetical protein [Serinibacter salmoneus]|uniref:Homeodomain-like domain-containing protein n=1 Tax=Serinibacter salmoneus TaxID=556530 RepID=A0A2A9CWF3_9MICO|nr:hypothetical protein [Serinibacter salmoneus]PFG18733.1 hypothetical protein ATL40_0276 [Serinibacter salmoneus]
MAEPSQRRLQRAIDALSAVEDPLERLTRVRLARQRMEELELEQIRSLREAGTPWRTIGAQYGLTKQGAQQRFKSALKDDA